MKIDMARTLIYMGVSALFMGLMIIWANLINGEASMSGPLAYAMGFQAIALPLYANDARKAISRLAGFLISCLVIGGMAALVLPQPDTMAALTGYALTGSAMLCACLLCAAYIRRRVFAFFAGFALLALWQAAPELAGLMDVSPLGAKLGRAILYLSPAARYGAFLNGSLDLSAAAFDISLALLSLYLIGRGGARRALRGVFLWALLSALLMIQPASLTQIDLTPERLTTISEQMAQSLRAVNLPVTVYQIAPAGAEDPWVALYLKKLSERHALIDARTVSPSEDKDLAALNLPENSLVIEQGDQWVLMRYENLYQSHGANDGLQGITFELEGALLTALDEATGLVMAGEGAPAGRYINQKLTMGEERRSALTIWLVISPALTALAGVALALVKKRYER